MGDDGEPSKNIGGGFGSTFDSSVENTVESRVGVIVDRLGDRYWRKSYGVQDAFSCLVRTILSQNTSDAASQPAFDALREMATSGDFPNALLAMSTDNIADAIRPAGLYNRKAEVLQAISRWVVSEFGGSEGFDQYISEEDYAIVRETLLSLPGVGPKTADCVLLFAGGQDGVFPVDTHVHRIYRRIGVAPPEADHEEVRAILEGRTANVTGVPPEKCGFGHTASIQFGREYCTSRSPVCIDDPGECPMRDLCDQVGIDHDAGVAVDPAETL